MAASWPLVIHFESGRDATLRSCCEQRVERIQFAARWTREQEVSKLKQTTLEEATSPAEPRKAARSLRRVGGSESGEEQENAAPKGDCKPRKENAQVMGGPSLSFPD